MNRHLKLGIKVLKNTRINSDLFKYIKNRVKILLLNREKETILPYPCGLMLELGNRCNLHCKICPREYTFGKNMDQGFMPLDKVYAIVDEVYPYLDSICLTGLGETFLYPQFLEVVKYIKSKRKSIIITVSTNANFKGFLEKITPALPYLDNVQFSVDGVGAVYESIRPNTDFSEIAQNIKTTVERGGKDVEFMINTVITKENFHDLPNVIEFAHSVGVSFVNFNRFNLASIPEFDDSYRTMFHTEEYRNILQQLAEYKKKYPGITFMGESLPDECNFKSCLSAWKHQYITWDGYMVPCCSKPFPKEMNFGNVFEKGVMGVLNGEAFIKFRKMWQQNAAPKFCAECNTIRY